MLSHDLARTPGKLQLSVGAFTRLGMSLVTKI